MATAEQPAAPNDTSAEDDPWLVVPGEPAAGLLRFVPLWGRLDESRFRFLVAAAGVGAATDWSRFRSLATAQELARWDQERDSLEVGRTVRAALTGLDPEAADAARRLLDQWLREPDPALRGDALRWAVGLGDWSVLDAAWLGGLRLGGTDLDPDVIEVLESIPVEARRVNPLLTWAWAAAAGHAAPAGKRESAAIIRVVADAVSLHARWRDAATVDAAVAAGSIWMLAQRFLPTSPASAALDAAWQSQNELAGYIAEQRRHADPPSPFIEVTFRAASARIALARGDLRHVVAEADFALALDPELAASLISGATNLALELAGLASQFVERPVSNLVFGIGLEYQDDTSGRLARGLAALRRLDRKGCEAVLAEFDGMPPGAPGWTGVVFLQKLVGALWGDPAETLNRTDAAVARHGLVWLEHRHALGSGLLGRGRVALLNRLGAYRVALEVAATLPPSLRGAAEAQTLLWSGDNEAAIRAAEVGLHDPETPLGDRVMLRVVRASALALDATTPAAEWSSAARAAIGACSEHELWVSLALVPPEARDRLLGVVPTGDVPGLALALERLAGLSGDPRRPGPRISLSRREQLLLPLLAGPQTVPEIAATLHVSVNTVRKQVVTLRAKLAAGSRQELIKRARDAGLV